MKKYMAKIIQKINELRYERKFYVNELNCKEIEYVIKSHPAFFSEVYFERNVNNIYLDSIDRKNYWDSLNGLNKREKLRIRWYGSLFGLIKKPYLEIKQKNNFLCCKDKYPLQPFTLSRLVSFNKFLSDISNSKISDLIKEKLKFSKFSLLNCYKRKYFLSADKKFRLTLDYNIKYFTLSSNNNTFFNTITDRNIAIIELKYKQDDDDLADKISSLFPFRLGKSSKYVSGINYLNYCSNL